jgi:hypothetical protein
MIEKRPKTFKGSKPAVKKTAVKKTMVKKAPVKKIVKKSSPKKTSPVIEKAELVPMSVQTVEEPISEPTVYEEPKEEQPQPASVQPEPSPIQSVQAEETVQTPENSPIKEDTSEEKAISQDNENLAAGNNELPETSSVPPFTPHFENLQDDEPLPKKRRVLLIVGIFVALLVLIIIAIFGYLYVSKKSSIPFLGNDVIHVKHVPVSPTAHTPTPTPTKIVDRSAYDIEVLNGSGKSGEAGKVKTLLTGENFIVSETGNAKRYTYTETVIEAKKTVSKDFLKELRTVLSQNYTVASTSSQLESSSSADVVVTVGRE